MNDERTGQTPAEQLDHISQTVGAELERFTNVEARAKAELSLSEAEKQLQDLRDSRTGVLGKKSGFASLKKLIGRLPTEERAAFGQRIQQKEDEFVQAFEEEEARLKTLIEAAR